MSDQIMVCADFESVALDMVAGTVDLIYTDPPYKRALAVPAFELLAEYAPKLLKDGGSLVTIVPHYLLEDVMYIMQGKLKYRWIYNMDQEDGSHPRMAMGIEICWKPMLHYVKRAYPQGRGFLRDKIISPEPDKSMHEWQQNEAWARYYIDKLTDPGDLVLDPFCGPGTVPAVCVGLDRNAIGVDHDPDVCSSGRIRIIQAKENTSL